MYLLVAAAALGAALAAAAGADPSYNLLSRGRLLTEGGGGRAPHSPYG